MREVVIVEALRTPIGRREGSLSRTRPDEVAALAIEALLKRSQVDPSVIEDVVMGCVTQVGEQGWNIARLAALIAGLPVEVPAVTVNRMCGSGQQAIHFASQAILAGDIDSAIAGGVESMSRVKMGSDGKDFSKKLEARFDLVWQGTSAEMMAKKWGLTRNDLDRFSMESHKKALQAISDGRFEREIAPVEIGVNGSASRFHKDEGPRADTSIEKLNSLKPAFDEKGVVTAGNSSQISDGASVVLLMAHDKAKELGLKPRARILSRVVTGSDPVLMLDGVIPATRKALQKANLQVADIDAFEINEAFACVPLAWSNELKPDMAKVNVNGGAIALGHPLGASGARLMTTLLHELERTNKQFGLQTMCIGHGMATATVIELLN